MKYLRNETVHGPTDDEYQKRIDKRRGRISIGNTGYDATYSAVDEKTGELHNEIMMESEPATAEYRDFNNTASSPRYKENDQLPLYHATEKPGTFRVGLVTGTERGRTHSMVLMAIAKARGEKFVGPTEIDPGDDLSAHSLALVKNAKERGLIGVNTPIPARPTNTHDFYEPEDIPIYDEVLLSNYGDKPVPAEDIKAGKNELKRMLGRTPQPKKQPPVSQEQFQQLKLDGF